MNLVPVFVAPRIREDSWLQEERFAAFRGAYGYASGQSNAIRGLALITPEDAYHVWMSIQRGMGNL